MALRPAIASALLLALVCGCGGGERTVTGRVKYKEPLSGGQVQFVGADGKSASGTIGPDGSYTVVGVPAGDVSVAEIIRGIVPPKDVKC